VACLTLDQDTILTNMFHTISQTKSWNSTLYGAITTSFHAVYSSLPSSH